MERVTNLGGDPGLADNQKPEAVGFLCRFVTAQVGVRNIREQEGEDVRSRVVSSAGCVVYAGAIVLTREQLHSRSGDKIERASGQRRQKCKKRVYAETVACDLRSAEER